jgi:hypothetical protein
MYIPIARERVRIKGHAGQFVVLRADYARQVADLADINDVRDLVQDVPFSFIFAPFEQPEKERHHPPRSEPSLDAKSKTKSQSRI